MKRKFIFLAALLVWSNCVLSNRIDELLIYLDNYELSEEKRATFFEAAEYEIESLNDNCDKTNYYFKLANRYWNFNRLDDYLRSSNLAIKNARFLNDVAALSKGYRYLGDYYSSSRINRDYIAYDYYTKAERLNTDLNDKFATAELNLSKGVLLFKIGDYLGSEKHISKAQAFYNGRNSSKLYSCYVNRGLIFQEFGDYLNAVSYLKKALSILDRTSHRDTDELAATLNNLGKIYLDLNDFVEAQHYFEQGLVYRPSITNQTVLALLMENLAVSQFNRNINDGGIESLFKRSIAIKDSVNYDRVASRINFSKYLNSKNRKKEALVLALEGYSIAIKQRNPRELLMAIKHVITIENKLAEKFSMHYIKLSDSLQIAERKIRNDFARISYHAEQVKLENETIVRQKQSILVISVGVILLISIASTLKLYRTRQKQLFFQTEHQKSNERIYDLLLNQQEKLTEVRINEQKRIARELHDGIINRLVSTRFNLFSLVKINHEEISEKSREYIERIQDIEQDIRSISHNLDSTVETYENKFDKIVYELVQQQNVRISCLLYHCENSVNWDTIDTKVKINIYRILQECFENIHRHANASEIKVDITKERNCININVNDNGVGFIEKNKNEGMGIRNIRYRASEIGAKVIFNSKINFGTTVKMVLTIN